MKRFIPALIALIIFACTAIYSRQPRANPDPNHTHADFAIWINGQMADFTDQKYQSEAYDPESGNQVRVDPMRKYLHLHDGNGHVLHRHKPGLTFGEFLESLGIVISKSGLNLCMEIPGKQNECENEALHINWVMIVNGERKPFFDIAYDFNDGDKILIELPQTDAEDIPMVWEHWGLMTDDACMFSKTCPWRGAPPTENCLADASIPCVIPD